MAGEGSFVGGGGPHPTQGQRVINVSRRRKQGGVFAALQVTGQRVQLIQPGQGG
jgi:hypothetical protein